MSVHSLAWRATIGGLSQSSPPQLLPCQTSTKNSEPDKVKWTDSAREAFTALKASLSSAPVLQGPDYSKQFFLQTDASDVGIGAVLSQMEGEVDRPVAYFSRKLLPREKNYAAMDKECLAIVEGVKHFA